METSYLNWLYIIPVIWMAFVWIKKKSEKRIKRFFSDRVRAFLTSSYSERKAAWKIRLEMIIFALLIATLARPQSGMQQQKEKAEGLEVVIIADVSPSMLAEDVRPSRIAQMQMALKRLLSLRAGDKIGIVALSGSSMLLTPLTTDKSALDMYIDSLTVDTVSTKGTDFKRGIQTAIEAIERGGASDPDDPEPKSGASRVVILASDGENHESGAREAVSELQKKGIQLYALNFGTSQGGPIPLLDRDHNHVGYKKDRNGQDIITQSRFEFMKELAYIGGGSAYDLNSGDVVQLLNSDLEKLSKGEFESRTSTIYDERFQIPLFLAFLLTMAELALGTRRKEGRIWKGRFERAA